MKFRKQISSSLIASILLFNLFILIPNISIAPAPLGPPDQFISEIFPNSTLPLQLSHTDTVILLNATKFPYEMGISFYANYSIYNPGNATSISVILPLSFETNITNFIFEVYENNTQIPYDLVNVSPWNENITAIEIHLAWFIELHPITLIVSNMTLSKNSTSTLVYHFRGSIANPLGYRDLFYMGYHLRTSEEWLGNTTGRIEYRTYGKEPIFSTRNRNPSSSHPEYVEINGGISFSYEWHNVFLTEMQVGVRYSREVSQYEILIEYILYYISPFIGIITIFIIIIIKRKMSRREIDHNPKRSYVI